MQGVPDLGPHDMVWLHEGLRDYIGLWQVVRAYQDDELSGEQLQAEVLATVRRLVSNGYFVLVDLESGGGSTAWSEDLSSALERIAREWNERGTPPNIPHMPWMKLTTEGRAVATAGR